MNSSARRALVSGAAVALLFVASSTTVKAQDSFSNFASGPGTYLFLAAGVGLPLLRDGSEGKNHFFRAADAGLSSVLLAEGLKRLTRVPRPDTGERDSFPGEHATAAFAVATMEADFHPREAPLWYAGASVISLSRLWEGRHRPLDLLGGAALGFATARLELSRDHGILLSPWIEHRSAGLLLTGRF